MDVLCHRQVGMGVKATAAHQVGIVANPCGAGGLILEASPGITKAGGAVAHMGAGSRGMRTLELGLGLCAGSGKAVQGGRAQGGDLSPAPLMIQRRRAIHPDRAVAHLLCLHRIVAAAHLVAQGRLCALMQLILMQITLGIMRIGFFQHVVSRWISSFIAKLPLLCICSAVFHFDSDLIVFHRRTAPWITDWGGIADENDPIRIRDHPSTRTFPVREGHKSTLLTRFLIYQATVKGFDEAHLQLGDWVFYEHYQRLVPEEWHVSCEGWLRVKADFQHPIELQALWFAKRVRRAELIPEKIPREATPTALAVEVTLAAREELVRQWRSGGQLDLTGIFRFPEYTECLRLAVSERPGSVRELPAPDDLGPLPILVNSRMPREV